MSIAPRKPTPWRRPIAARAFDAIMAPLERRTVARWRRQLWKELPSTGVGLEIGIGTGASLPFHPPMARVIGMDLSVAMLDRLRNRSDGHSRPVAAADVQRLPFGDASFDWATATFVFCEVPDPVAGLREVLRVLRPGAPLVLIEHVRPAGLLGHAARAATAVSAPLIGEHFDRDTAAAVRAAGFVQVRTASLWRDLVVRIGASK
jgi:phosphatidylethanolamine/phosphatidyl-N-methylethanolamine N-methyltransferase